MYVVRSVPCTKYHFLLRVLRHTYVLVLGIRMENSSPIIHKPRLRGDLIPCSRILGFSKCKIIASIPSIK